MLPFKTYVINLEEQKMRWQNQSQALIRSGIRDPIRFSAWKYDEIPRDHLSRHFVFSSLIPKTTIACAYSHLQVYKTFLADTGNPGIALVLEDDAYPLFYDAGVHLLSKLDKYAESNWDLLALHCDGKCPDDPHARFSYAGSFAAYFVSRKGAERMLNSKVTTHVDVLTSLDPTIKKIVDVENSFWVDEDGFYGEMSTNRKTTGFVDRCRSIVGKITGRRGEKCVCQMMTYNLIRTPVPGFDLAAYHIGLLVVLVVIFGVALLGISLIKQTSKTNNNAFWYN